jgi:peptide chain release factor 2
MAESTFWDDIDQAKKIIRDANEIKSWIDPLQDLKRRIEDMKALLPDAREDDSFFQELEKEAASCLHQLEELEMRRMLSHELDKESCYLSVNAGAGGTEACDWAQMLFRMYMRWAAKRGWKVEVIDQIEGEVAGIRTGTIRIDGPFSYGYAKAERGVHRLVRISPFDSNARRHTSFAAVDIVPVLPDDIAVEMRMEDIKVDTFRSSGAGGQHVNTTDSAVRMTHIPTGLIVSCQSQRSQIQNREACLKLLKAKIYDLEIAERKKNLENISGEKKEIGWGSQIRNYVFQPYTLVKDARTKYEKGDVQAVMDGEIDEFIHAYLKEFGG